MSLLRSTRQDELVSSNQWLNRIGIISLTLPWIREPFGLRPKPKELYTRESLQRRLTGCNTKPANNSVLTGLPNMISRCTEKVEIRQKNAESSKKSQVLIKNKVFLDARKPESVNSRIISDLPDLQTIHSLVMYNQCMILRLYVSRLYGNCNFAANSSSSSGCSDDSILLR